MPCTARFVGPNYNMQGGLAPDVVGGEFCLAAVSFLSPFGRPLGAGGGGGSRFQAGARVLTAPARIRDGTQGIANFKGGSF